MKKSLLIIGLLIGILAILPFVSAQYSMWSNLDLGEGMRNLIDQAVNFLTPVFELILGDYSGSEYFFAKVLLVLLLSIIIHAILERMPLFEGYRGTTTIIAIIVSVLGIRFLQDDLIQMIILPYNTLAIALAAFLPFLIVAYGIYFSGMGGLGRKLSWIVFLTVFVIMWVYRTDKIGDIGNQIYLWTSVVGGLMMIFDRRVHAYFMGLEGKKIEESVNDERIARLEAERKYITDYPAGGGGQLSDAQKRTVRALNRQIAALRARRGFFR